MKKVAFVTRVISSGGAENVLRQIVCACANQGMECTVFTVWKNINTVTLPENVKVCALLPMGYPAEDAKPLPLHSQFRPMEETVSEI